MGQIKAEFEIVEEFAGLAQGLKEKYPEVFDAIDTDKIRCVAITNKERKEGKNLWSIKPVSMPIKMDCPYNYYIILFMKDWIEMEEKHRLLLLADVLHSIPDDGNDDGKVLQPDMKDFAVMLRTFGVDYLTNNDVPHLLNDRVNWVQH